MRLLAVMDPIEAINPKGDSTFMMLLEAERRGWRCYYTLQADLSVVRGRPHALARRVSVRRGDPFFTAGDAEALWLDELDVILARKDPPFDRDFLFATYILDLAVGKALVVNDPVGLKLANEKMYALQFPGVIPATTVSNRAAALRDFMLEQGGEAILKPWDQAGGGGIFHIHAGDRNLKSLLETATRGGREYVIAQRYLPEVRQGDKRVILVDGEPVGAMLRVPAEDDHRSNMHVGGSVVRSPVTERDREICRTLAPALKRDGLLFVGIDVIGGMLTEVNVTSPTGIQEINRLEGLQVEVTLMDAIEDRLRRGVRTLRIS